MSKRGRDYRANVRKDVTAPSGNIYTIRKPGAKTYSKQFRQTGQIVELPEDIEDVFSDENINKMAKEAMEGQSPEELVSSMDILILECVVDPKVVANPTEEDGELWIEDVGMADYFFLFKEITEFAGVTPEKLRELFRDLRGASGASSG